ncbi:MAG: hypothetical protein IPL53_20080 [Ignavibacteria bacterium]|nr:hypothetical protein [Ignavibacteria bacterium]
MQKLKIKKQNGLTRKKRINIRNKREENADSLNFLFLEEEFPLVFPLCSLYKNVNKLKVKS